MTKITEAEKGVVAVGTLDCVESAGIGFGLGLLVAVQLGPMSLFLVRSTLRGGLPAGLGAGAGIAVVDGLYAAAGAAGASALLSLGSVRTALGLLGAAAIAWLGLRSLRTARHPEPVPEGRAAAAPGAAFRTALLATAANPTTILSWTAVFSATPVGTQPVLLVTGVLVGSLVWVTALAAGVSAVRRAVSPGGIRVADAVSGLGLLGFAGALAWGAVA